MEKPFKVVSASFEALPDGEVKISFVLDKCSADAWRRLVDPLPDDGELTRAIELLLERCREAS